MNILVFIKAVPDVKIPALCDTASGSISRAWEIVEMSPADRSALETALAIKEKIPGTRLTAIHLGPSSGESYIRESIALGCDAGLRVWDEGLEEIQPQAKAVVFSRLAAILGYDLLLTGNASQDRGNGQVGLLIASHLKIPCLTSVLGLEIDEGGKTLSALRRLDRGYRARIQSPIPALIAMETIPESYREPSLSDRINALEQDIQSLSLADLGIPRDSIRQLELRLRPSPMKSIEPKLQSMQAPDHTQPGFVRIAQLVRGTLRARAGRSVGGSKETVTEALFQLLLKEGWLDHLRKNG